MSKLAQLTTLAMLPVVNPSPKAPPGMQTSASTALGYLMWGAGIICFVSIVVLGMIFMLNATGRTNGAKDVVVPVGWVGLGAFVIAGASTITYQLIGV